MIDFIVVFFVFVFCGFCKQFGQKVVVDDLFFDVFVGFMFGLFGFNGVGKMMMFVMIIGLLCFDVGMVWVFGVDVWQDFVEVKVCMGVLLDGICMFDCFIGVELFCYIGLFWVMLEVEFVFCSGDLFDVLGLFDVQDIFVVDYFVGMWKKIGFVCVFIYVFWLFIFDEFFEVVDLVFGEMICQILCFFVDNGGIVVLLSYVMEFVELLCDWVVIVVEGCLFVYGFLDEVCVGMLLQQWFFVFVGVYDLGMEMFVWLCFLQVCGGGSCVISLVVICG